MDTILIVDDSAFIVEGLIAFLKKKYHTLAAYSGGECLEILNRESPSVIILDIMMEPMDGWETLARIKQNNKTRLIPVVMFSAIKISPQEAEKHRISIDDCLTKPVSPNKIIEAIEKVLTRRDTNRMVVERWQSAGISQEKIDEYLSLASNLEVDLSLCQNIKVQYDLGHPEDKNREEFQAVISAVSDRILQERDQIETLAREMNEVLARGTGIRDPAAPLRPSPEEEEPVPSQSSPVISGRESTPGGISSAILPDVPVSQEPGSNRAIPGPEVPVSQEPGSTRAIPEPEVPRFQEPPVALDAGPAPDESDETPEQVPADPEEPAGYDAGEPGSPESVNGLAEGGEREEIMPEEVTSPDTPPAAPVPAPHELPAMTTRKVIPASLDIPPESATTTSDPGAGTDVPMPWDTRDRKSRTAVPAQAKADAPGKPDTPQPAPGIFARILSLVRSLFGRRT